MTMARSEREHMVPKCACCYYALCPSCDQDGTPLAPGWRCHITFLEHEELVDWHWSDVGAPHAAGWTWDIPLSHRTWAKTRRAPGSELGLGAEFDVAAPGAGDAFLGDTGSAPGAGGGVATASDEFGQGCVSDLESKDSEASELPFQPDVLLGRRGV